MKRPVHIPDLGDFRDVEVLEVVAKPGDILAPEAPLVTLESDKAAMDVPAPFAGKVLAIHIKAGDKVNQGDHVADMETEIDSESDSESKSQPESESESKPESESGVASPDSVSDSTKPEPENKVAPPAAPASPRPLRPRPPSARPNRTPARASGDSRGSWALTCIASPAAGRRGAF